MRGLLAIPALLVLSLSVSVIPAHAQYGDAAADLDAIALPEGSSWARVRHLEGQVTLLQDRAETNEDLGLNAPVTPGDILETGRDGRIELQLADGSVIWLDERARLSIQALADGQSQFENRTLLSLENGTLIIEVEPFDGEEKVFRVDTEAATIFLLEAGLYRIDAGTSGGTRVTSRRGVAEVLGVDGSVLVRSGEGNFTRPGYAPENPRVVSVRRGDEFDAYVDMRRDIYLSRGGGSYVAYEDEIPAEVQPYLVELDAYGSWQRHPTYGAVWVPAVDIGWRPYYNGYWATRPVGNVWVSHDIWGYAPYHYGRWEYLPGYGWSWMPGGLYAPAWVSWGYYGSYVGWSPIGWYNYPSGWSISIHFGAFHGSYWNFVPYHHFYHHRVNTVLVKDRIIAADVTYASGPPRISMDDVRARRQGAVFADARTEARLAKATPVRGRQSAPDRTASFRQLEKEVTAARGRQRTTSLASSRRADLPLARTPGRAGTPAGPDLGKRAVRSRPSVAASPRTVRSRTSGDTSARVVKTGSRESGRVPSRTTSRAGGTRDTGRSSAVREKPTTRQVPAREPRRILTATRTRRAPAAEKSRTTARGSTRREDSRRPTVSSGSSRSSRVERKPASTPRTQSPRATTRSSGSSSRPPRVTTRSSGSSSRPSRATTRSSGSSS
ncbi:MAG: FecR domain-containing protein, partial [Acidobacteria bacterium]|nr:FecR domain-containing protein [Acidobacteriota bacterium]